MTLYVEHLIDGTANFTTRVQAANTEEAQASVLGWDSSSIGNLTKITVNSIAVVEVNGVATDQDLFGDFRASLRSACRQVHMDSNDDEIERLWEVASIACGLLGVDLETTQTEAYAWAEEHDYI